VMIKEAATNGAKIVALPECFNSPYGVSKLVTLNELSMLLRVII